jgi:flavin-dependent dehydrogenase
MSLARAGIRTVILEQETFPRYHIGESLTGAGGNVLRELGLEQEMYTRQYPTKQGVKVYGNSPRGAWWVPVMGRDAQGRLFPWDTWQMRRSDFDTMLLDAAVACGTSLVPGKGIKPLVHDDGSVRGVQVRMPDSRLQEIEAQMVLDCSGQATFLANAGGVTGPKYLGNYDKQIAIFSQVVGAIRDDGISRETHRDNTLILAAKKFHWAWFIPLDEEVVSVGIVVPAAYFQAQRESKHAFFLRELHDLHPELQRRLPKRKLVEDVHVIPNYSYQVRHFCGRGFMCIGDAHRFIDPIFSYGLTIALREAQIAVPMVKAYLEGAYRDRLNPFAEHQLTCERAIDILEDTIDLFWEKPLTFAASVHHFYKEEMIDVFAGRVYEGQPSHAVLSARKSLGRERERARSYDMEDLYSVPIGSRFHPERAPLWEVKAPIENT